jgi:hypothetical protein
VRSRLPEGCLPLRCNFKSTRDAALQQTSRKNFAEKLAQSTRSWVNLAA